MTKSSVSKPVSKQKSQITGDVCGVLSRPAPLATDIPMEKILQQAKDLAGQQTRSTARYFTFNAAGRIEQDMAAVCFHAIHTYTSHQNVVGVGIVFQGYGGFISGDRFRKATEADLYTNVDMPFHMNDQGYYNETSLAWLDVLLDPEGPFKDLLPLMAWNTPEEVQAKKCFLFPDKNVIPARLAWSFAIASRLGFANPRVVWRYLHLLEMGVSKNLAFLIAGGFEHEVVGGDTTGKIIKSYTCGFLGVDVTAYAGRIVYANPVKDKPFKESKVGTYGSAKVFECGKMDLKNLRFDNWQDVIVYCQSRADEQNKALQEVA